MGWQPKAMRVGSTLHAEGTLGTDAQRQIISEAEMINHVSVCELTSQREREIYWRTWEM